MRIAWMISLAAACGSSTAATPTATQPQRVDSAARHVVPKPVDVVQPRRRDTPAPLVADDEGEPASEPALRIDLGSITEGHADHDALLARVRDHGKALAACFASSGAPEGVASAWITWYRGHEASLTFGDEDTYDAPSGLLDCLHETLQRIDLGKVEVPLTANLTFFYDSGGGEAAGVVGGVP